MLRWVPPAGWTLVGAVRSFVGCLNRWLVGAVASVGQLIAAPGDTGRRKGLLESTNEIFLTSIVVFYLNS